MKILLLGAGGQGGPCASIMARDEAITEAVMADANFEFAKKVAAKVNYVSTSFDVPYLDQFALGQGIYLDKELKEAGVKVLLGCGTLSFSCIR